MLDGKICELNLIMFHFQQIVPLQHFELLRPLLGKIIQINAEIVARHQSLEALRVSVPFEKSKLRGSPDQTPSSMTEESLDLTQQTASNGIDAVSVSVE